MFGTRLANILTCCAVAIIVVGITVHAIALAAFVADLPTRVPNVALVESKYEAASVFHGSSTHLNRELLRHLCLTTRAAPLDLVFGRITVSETH
jgi:hypothetical protein